jgi:predicted transcriptional regulator
MKRQPIEIKKKIFFILKEKNDISINKLQRKVNTNYQSIVNNCKELEYLGFLKIESTQKDTTNGKPYLKVKLLKFPKEEK